MFTQGPNGSARFWIRSFGTSKVRRRTSMVRYGALAAVAIAAIPVLPASAEVHLTQHLPNAVRAASLAPYATATYSVKDVGAPPVASYRVFYQPLGFNATGQIVGEAYPSTAPYSSYQHCIAWTGVKYVDLVGTNSLTCYATSGISNANSKGVFATVGGTYVPTNTQEVAFYSVVGSTSATATTFPANSPSELWTMNASGLAAGNSYYGPATGFSYPYPPVTSTGTALTLLQPQCTTEVRYCMYYPYQYASQSGESRSINASGTIFGTAIDQNHGTYVEYAGGSHPTAVQFSLPLDEGYGPSNIRGMDDKGNVVYVEYDPPSAKYLTWTFGPTSKARKLGVLSNNSCTQYIPLSINGPGRVLGYTQSCSFASDATYWTWDSTNGMVAIAFTHTAYSSANLYLINDLGEIAGDFTTIAGVHHWGYLKPPSKL